MSKPFSTRIVVAIRPVAESDLTGLRRFFTALSSETAYARFFGDGFRATGAMLDVLAGLRLPGRAFVALNGEEIVGHALWTPLRGHNAADLGLVVADAWQGHGVGSQLLDRTLADARASGTTRLEFSVLAENRRVNRLVRSWWARSAWAIGNGVVDYDIAFDAPFGVTAA